MAAIMGYVGQRLDIWHDGRWQQAIGWQSTKKQRWSEGMSERWVSICDIPDLSLFPQRYPSAKSVVFRAGLELPILHWGTWVLSWLTRLNLVRNWARFASTLTKVSRWFMRFGTDIGGMHMRVTGKNPSGEPITLTFELVAHHNDGPKIPALAAVILCKKWLQAEALIAGASPCVGHISLSEFIVEAQDLSIRFFGPKT